MRVLCKDGVSSVAQRSIVKRGLNPMLDSTVGEENLLGGYHGQGGGGASALPRSDSGKDLVYPPLKEPSRRFAVDELL